MTTKITIHFDNRVGFVKPALLLYQSQAEIAKTVAVEASSQDESGATFEVPFLQDTPLTFKFGDQDQSRIEDDSLYRTITTVHADQRSEVWCRSSNEFVYTAAPQIVEERSAAEVVNEATFKSGIFISNTEGRFALGASVLDNGVLFGLFHPHAARVYVTGDFNNWQYPGAANADASQFLEMRLYRGYFDAPNVWLLKVDAAQAGQEYKFWVEYNSLAGDYTLENRLVVDPNARFLGNHYDINNAVIVDASPYEWHDGEFHTTPIHDLILYELNVHGFTHAHPDIEPDLHGRYAGIVRRIEAGYFDNLGITCLYLMPVTEVPTPQGEDAMGYNPSLFMAIERDFGTPDELRHLVDTAHQHGLSVIIDQVFNHTANSWNPLWKYILDHPDEAHMDAEGGLYFSGSTPWGNRLATERVETGNMLIDACKLMIAEYHIDGFRFDATSSNYMDHPFVHRLAHELQAFKPDVILIAENLPNEADLNREGYNGFGQWCDYFHDAMKAFLREARFEGTDDHPENLGDIFYFSKGKFAAHTNNVVNYCESHDEHSVAHEISFVPELNTPEAKDRKARLGLFATMAALGQPMIYMGQEFGSDRERNRVYFDFPANLAEQGYYQWAARLISLRRRYPGLKLHGFNPIEDGLFQWLIGPWLEEGRGGGKRVIGWLAKPSDEATDQLLVLLNFENYAVEVALQPLMAGRWVRLASIETVNDIAPAGTNTLEDAITIEGDTFPGFVLPSSSAFIYKWQNPL